MTLVCNLQDSQKKCCYPRDDNSSFYNNVHRLCDGESNILNRSIFLLILVLVWVFFDAFELVFVHLFSEIIQKNVNMYRLFDVIFPNTRRPECKGWQPLEI